MRWLAFLVTSLVASAAVAAPSSNPTFLGIEMDDVGAGCSVQAVTNCSPAKEAGLRFGDTVLAMDGVPLYDLHRPVPGLRACDVLRQRIMAREPGDVATYDVRRGRDKLQIKAQLSTRADVQHRCFVDQPLDPIDVFDLDNTKSEFDLGGERGKTTVLGWFRLDQCVGCSKVFDRIADGLARRLRDEHTPRMLGVTMQGEGKARPTRVGFTSTVQVAVAKQKDFEERTFKESGRVQVMVVDCRGIVRFVAPIAPDAEDLEAAIDEVLAATEQAEHLRSRR